MKLIILFIALTYLSPVLCQDKISGKVRSDKGQALHGASVFISNTKTGTTTNENGEFVLDHLPAGNFQLVISFVGYETTTAFIIASERNKNYVIQMQPVSKELKDVIVGNYDKGGWKKWGKAFTEAFIGTSVFAKNCVIKNTEVIKFVLKDKTNMLYAYAYEPIFIDNNALGYYIEVTLADFKYELDTKIVDYQTYSLFSEMKGTDDQQLQWKSNREKAYGYSLLHFMRALYDQNLKNEGFQVRRIEAVANVEKQRVQQLYKSKFDLVKDSLQNITGNEVSLNKQVEKLLNADSLSYYQQVLAEDDQTANLHFEPENFKDIAHVTDSNTVIFHFHDYLQVTYTKEKEPEEYLTYRRNLYVRNKLITSADFDIITRGYPNTELSLSQDIPVEISENGYFTNVDLFMNGFWGWWEKMATTLPYEYEP